VATQCNGENIKSTLAVRTTFLFSYCRHQSRGQG